MDTNALLIDAITTIVTAFITFGIVAIMPYLLARRKEKAEKALITDDSETKKSVAAAEALEKMTGAFGEIQNFYATALAAANAKVTELREEIAQLEKLGGKISQMEEMAEKIVELTDKIIDLKRDVKLAKMREARLKELATLLINQLRRLEQEPVATLDELDV